MSTVIDQPSSYHPTSTYPEVSFNLRGIPPPSQQYVTREDVGVITSFNAASGIGLEVHGRMLLPNGTVVPFVQTHVPNTDRSSKTDIFAIPEGYLLNVSVFLASGSAKRGQCYVMVKLGRGQATARVDHQVLLQGYVGSSVQQAWPGNRLEQPTEGPGVLRSIVGTTPAAGADISETVPTGARWRPIVFFFSLTTSAAVANRQVRFQLQDASGNIIYHYPSQINQPASQTYYYNFAAGLVQVTPVGLTDYAAPLPIGVAMLAGYKLRTLTAALDVADQFTAPNYEVEEWIEP